MSVSWILYVLVIVQSTQTLNALFPEIDPIDYGYNGSATVTEYIFHTESLCWNKAKQVCEINGGTLAKIDTLALHRNIYSVAKARYGRHIFENLDFYTSLVLKDNQKVWTSDCSLLTENERAEINDNNCYKVDEGLYSFEIHDDCQKSRPFLCQKSTDTPCGETLIMSKNYIMQSGKNVTMCSKSCHEDIACWATIRYLPDMCIKVMYPGYGAETLEVAVKECIKVTLNQTTSGGYNDGCSDTAIHNCKDPNNGTQVTFPGLVSPNISGLTSSSASPAQCYNLTETITVVSSITVSTTVIQPSTVVQISKVYIPETVSAITTVSPYVTVTVTQTLTQNITYNLTSEHLAEVESKAAEIVKNLTVDTKTTSSYVRTLTCAEDSRSSSSFIGYVGVLFVVIPLAVIVLSDLRKLINDFRNAYNGCRR